jgi:hypothetical protein
MCRNRRRVQQSKSKEKTGRTPATKSRREVEGSEESARTRKPGFAPFFFAEQVVARTYRSRTVIAPLVDVW